MINLKSIIGESWYNILNNEEKEYFLQCITIVNEKRLTQEILPLETTNSGIFYALKLTPFDKVKVLIFGQDPYPNKEDAHGLAFSKLSGKIPASLKNIFEKIQEEMGICNTSGNLTPWAEQGVLLLNRALTYSKNESLSTRNKFWLPVINIIINKLLSREKPLVIMLWGNPANDIEQFAFDKEEQYSKHNIYILRSSHPSNMGNAKNCELKDGRIKAFTAIDNFKKTNELLVNCGEKIINWTT